MLRTLQMPDRRYPSIGRCIFCDNTTDLTDEHVVPEALSGIGQMVFEKGTCRRCNSYANQAYEQPALNADFLAVRHMLGLKRKRRGRNKRPRSMPLVSANADVAGTGADGFDVELTPEQYPPIAEFLMHPPAGLLTGEDKSDGSPSVRVVHIHLGRPISTFENGRIVTREKRVLGAPEMSVAKMAYCYAAGERGLHQVSMLGLRDLLSGNRDDVFNFVGSPVRPENLAANKLHAFYFRKRGPLATVLVHLFASFHGPVYEVVLGPV